MLDAALDRGNALVNRIEHRMLEPLTRELREEPLEFLGYRIGRNYRTSGRETHIGTRPSRASVQSICRKAGEQTAGRNGLISADDMVERLNRMLSGWAGYYDLGQVSPACKAVDSHATRRLRQWFCRKHKVRNGKFVRFPNERLWNDCGLMRLAPRTRNLPWAKA